MILLPLALVRTIWPPLRLACTSLPAPNAVLILVTTVASESPLATVTATGLPLLTPALVISNVPAVPAVIAAPPLAVKVAAVVPPVYQDTVLADVPATNAVAVAGVPLTRIGG